MVATMKALSATAASSRLAYGLSAPQSKSTKNERSATALSVVRLSGVVNEANAKGSMENDKNETKSNSDALGGDEEINDAQGKEEGAGENEYDMQVNDIMGHIKDSHPEVASRLHKALTKHLGAKSANDSNEDYAQRSNE